VTSLLLALALAASGDLAAQVKAKLDEAPVQRGTFESKKQVKGFKRPLVSSGQYVVTKGQGVQWNTLKPFASELTVKADEISNKQGGAEVFKLDANKEPTVRLITQLLFSLLSGDLATLATHFEATGDVKEKDWAIELTPKSEGVKKVFTTISLKGDRAVRSVVLREASGDVTEIALTPTP
jgi:hypothetical protein